MVARCSGVIIARDRGIFKIWSPAWSVEDFNEGAECPIKDANEGSHKYDIIFEIHELGS